MLMVIALGFAAYISAVGRDYDRPYLRSWRAAWFALAVHALFAAAAMLTALNQMLPSFRPAFSVIALLAAWTHLYFLHEGTWRLCLPERKLPAARHWVSLLACVVAVALVFAPVDPMLRYQARVTVLSVTWGLAYIFTGILLARDAPALSWLGRRTLAGALFLYGGLRLVEQILLDLVPSPILEQLLIFGGIPLVVAMGAGMLITLLDAERRELFRTAELRTRAEARFGTVVENSSDIILILSRQGVIEYASPSLTRALGHEPQAIQGAFAIDFAHPDDVIVLNDAMARAFARDRDGPKVVPFRVRMADGEYARLEAVSRPFDDVDGKQRLLVNARDVRARVQLETQLVAARRLETVGRLAGGVAHDFNNLLTAILGNVTLMRATVDDHPALRASLEEIEDAAQRGAELTRRLLTFARRQVIEPRVLDLGTKVHGLERLLHRLLGEDVRLVVDGDKPLWPVRTDPTAFEQALVNLVVNARDAMPGGGQLSIRMTNCPLGNDSTDSLGVPAGDWVRIDVSDTGVGIDEATLGRIFEPFFTTKGSHGGSGLGLATVYGIVAQAGGHVRVRSTPGAGSCFTLFFPRIDGVVEATPRGEDRRQRIAPSTSHEETVLLIEDDESVRTVTARILRGFGFHVLTAVDGADGIATAAKHESRIHVVVSDLVMPNIGGVEAVARIREQRPDVRVVFISGFSEDALSWRGAMPEGGTLLSKPFSGADLARSVRGQAS